MMPDLVRSPACEICFKHSRLRSYLACIRTSRVRRLTVSRLWETTSGRTASTRSRFSQIPLKSGNKVSNVVSGLSRRMALMVSAQMIEPPSRRSSRSTDVITQCFTCISFTEFATRLGSSVSTASGRPVATAQNEHERVQMLPSIINVAVPAPQHSPILGQFPLSQMVCSLCVSTRLRTWAYSLPTGSLTRNQSGLRLVCAAGTTGNSIINTNVDKKYNPQAPRPPKGGGITDGLQKKCLSTDLSP